MALVVSYFCFYSSSILAQEVAPDDPDQAITGEQYITPNLVDDPLSWSGPQSQGDCTYRPSGHGTYGNDPAHSQGDWYTNPAYRSCPQISSDGVMRFGWRPEEDMALTNNIDDSNPIIAPYATALAEAGIIVNGYNYSWTIKSADVNNIQNTTWVGPYDKEGYGFSQDLLSITVEFIGKENQDVVWSKEYDYNYRIDDWTKFSGSEAFELNGTDFEKIRITVDGYDAGYWAGYFGPEVQQVQFQLLFTVVETDNCDEDPLSSPTCYGYQDAFNKSIGLPTQAEVLAELESNYGGSNVDTTGQQKIEDFFDGGTPDGTSFEYDEEIEAGIEEEIQVFEQEQLQAFEEEQQAQQTGTTVDDGQSTGVSQEETTGISSEESTGVADPVEEATEAATKESTEEAKPITSEKTPSTTTSNVNALAVAQGAEAAGNAVAGSAVSLATGAAATSLNRDVATSTSLNQQAQQESINALNDATESVISNSSSKNTAVSGAGSSDGSGLDLDFSSNMSGDTVSTGDISSNNTSTLTENVDVVNAVTVDLNNYTSNSNGSASDANSLEFDNSASNNGIDTSTGLSNDTGMINSDQLLSNSQLGIESVNETDQSVFAVEFEIAALNENVLDDVINNVINTMLLMQNAAQDNFKEDTSDEGQLTAEEEDTLVAAAQSGDDSEDAQAALLGYNPNFRAYQAPQLPDSQFYQPREIYGGQENYDNPNQRFFNGASDATHREMVRQQYERE